MRPEPKTVQIDLSNRPLGCSAEVSLQGHRLARAEDDALCQTRLGRLVLWLRARVERLVVGP
jgi:hypothetical protein